MKRSIEKNALAISSNQSRRIKDLEEVQRKFSNTLTDLKKKNHMKDLNIGAVITLFHIILNFGRVIKIALIRE